MSEPRRRADDPGEGDRRRAGSGRISHGGQARRRDASARTVRRPSERRRDADPARRVAYDTLRAVSEGAYANLELPSRLRAARLEGRDAAFATELVYGVVRMRGRYDAILERCAGRPIDRIDAPVLDVLRLGAHQLLGMRVPAHAAVDATVGLARATVGSGASSFTNAVLRRVSEKTAEEWLAIVAPGALPGESASVEDLAVAYSHPAWVVRALRRALVAHGVVSGADADAEVVELLRADNDPADVTLVARPGLCEPEELLDAGARAGALSPVAAVLTDGGDPGRIPAVREGRAGVQDEGSQLLVLALVAAYDAAGGGGEPGARWLDLCAGPGGKAALLAALAMSRGATVFANEVSPHRARLVEQAVEPVLEAGGEVFVGVGDGRTVGAEEPASFDLVLVDAPCTGLGALRRRPDARWRREPSDVADLTALQEELLASGLDALRPGGVLGYATCSPHEAETLEVVRRVLRGREDVDLLDATVAASSVIADAWGSPEIGRNVGNEPFLQVWPHRHGTDAMFLAVCRKKGTTG